jgi:glycosyltransferase involved in cell wall biosynthesis
VPRVSVITPILNAEPYLAATIASVRAQTFGDWEMILIDDGSTDGSLAIARQAALADTRIRVIEAEQTRARGAAAARNRGTEAAAGALIAYLDADDLYEPAKLAHEVAILDRHPEAEMTYGATRWWQEGPPERSWIEPMRGRQTSRLHEPTILLRKAILMSEWHIACTCAVMIRKPAIIAVGGFEERFRLYEDQSLWAKLFLRYPVYVYPECFARYRQHGNSVSAQAADSNEYSRTGSHGTRVAFLDWLTRYIEDSGVNDRRLARAVRLANAPYGGSGAVHAADLATLWLKSQYRRGISKIRRLPEAFKPPEERTWWPR